MNYNGNMECKFLLFYFLKPSNLELLLCNRGWGLKLNNLSACGHTEAGYNGMACLLLFLAKGGTWGVCGS